MWSAVKKGTALVLIPTSLLFLPGCGVIFGGSNQNVSLDSSPNHSTVEFKQSGRSLVTPSEVSLPRKGNYVITFSREGYESHQVEISRHLRAGILVLDILVGLVGVIVDAATGAWYRLEPKRVDVTLVKTDAALEGPAQIHVEVGLQETGADGRVLRLDSSAPVQVRIERKD
jgi:hypothetical protein